MKRITLIAAGLAAATFTTPAMAALVIKAEAPGAFMTGGSPSTAGGVEKPVFDYVGMETFNNRALGEHGTLTSDFNTQVGGFTNVNSQIKGTYSNVVVRNADVYGGASTEEGEKYAVAGLGNNIRSYEIAFSQEGASGLNYFGFWLSALDGGNTVEFFNGDLSVGKFDATAVGSYLTDPGYKGNPFGGGNGGEAYAFLNFYLENDTFNRIKFSQAPGGAGYESDNHTVGYYTKQGGGTTIPAVPEPATWAMMILGFGVVGGAMRSRRRNTRMTYSYN